MDVRCPACARVVPAESGTCPRCGAELSLPLRHAWAVRLLWACPACQAEAPLVVQQRLFGEATLGCRVCGAAWVLDPETATLAQRDPATRQIGPALPLAEWQARLPPPLSWRAVPTPQLLLQPDETCWLGLRAARMLTPRVGLAQHQPLGRVEIMPGIYERVARDPTGPSPRSLATEARGPLFITNRRIAFMGDRKQVEVLLSRLLGAEVDEGFLVLHRAARTDTFGVDGESAVRVLEALQAIRQREAGEDGASGGA